MHLPDCQTNSIGDSGWDRSASLSGCNTETPGQLGILYNNGMLSVKELYDRRMENYLLSIRNPALYK